MVEQMRFELTTPTMRTWCSSQLSYCPNQYGDSNIQLVFDLSSLESAFFEKKHRDIIRSLTIFDSSGRKSGFLVSETENIVR